MHDKRRVKIVSVDPRLFLNACFPQSLSDCFHYVKLPLPVGYHVESVTASWERNCIDVMVSHPSFPEVEWSEMPERIPGIYAELVAFGRVEGSDADMPTFREAKRDH